MDEDLLWPGVTSPNSVEKPSNLVRPKAEDFQKATNSIACRVISGEPSRHYG